MAKYDVTYTCGHTGIIDLWGKSRDRKWRLDREEEKRCPDCWKKQQDEEREKENAAAIAENQAAGLPPLEGTEKQVPWAEAIRSKSLKKIEAYLQSPREDWEEELLSQEGIEVGLKSIRTRTDATWWIDQRGEVENKHYYALMLLKEEYETVKNEQEAPPAAVVEAANTEATVRPENPKTETVAEISISGDTAKIRFPEKRDDFWQIAKKELGYRWDGVWERKLTTQNGTPADRAAEAGHVLLGAGFIIRIFDEAIREAATTGAYAPEQTRWIMARVADAEKYAGWFVVEWKRPDDFYAAARNLPSSRYDSPSVVVPPEHFEDVLDFAEKYGFSLSPGAQRAADAARAAKESALVARVEPAKKEAFKADTKPLALDAPEGVEVDESLRDDD